MSPNPRPALPATAARFLAVLDSLAEFPPYTGSLPWFDTDGSLIDVLTAWARSRNTIPRVELRDGRPSHELVIGGVTVSVHDWRLAEVSAPAVKDALAEWRPSDSEVANG